MVVRVEGNTVVAGSTVKDSLLGSTRYGTGLMKWAVCDGFLSWHGG